MNHPGRKEWTTLVTACIVLITGFAPSYGWDFRTGSRLRFITGYDDNIFEEANETIHDEVIGIMFFWSGKWNTDAGRSFGLDYHGGYHKYWSYSCETRCIHEVEGWGKARLWHHGSLGLRGTARYKNFPHSQRDSWRGNGEIWLQFILPKGILGKVYFGKSFLDYPSYDFFDYSAYRCGMSFRKRVSKRLSLGIDSSFDRWTSDRTILDYQEGITDVYEGHMEKQIDRLYQITLFMEYFRELLLKIDYSFERDNSNSFGYSYRKHHILVLLAKNMLWH